MAAQAPRHWRQVALPPFTRLSVSAERDLPRSAPYQLGRRSSRRGDYPSASGIGQTTTTRYRTINLLSIGVRVRYRLRPDYPAAVHPCGRTLRLSVAMIATSLLRYSFRHSHSSALHRRFRADFTALTTLPYRSVARTRSFGASLCPVTASAQRCLTSELLRTLSRMAASKPTSWLSERRHNLSHSAMTWGP